MNSSPAVHSPTDDLSEENPDALLADGFEKAFVGIARRCGQPSLAVYSIRLCIRVLMDRDGMSYEEAVEFFEYNVVGAWMGPMTPIFLDDLRSSLEEKQGPQE